MDREREREKYALLYLEQGWSVIPLRPRGKEPAEPWKRWCSERPSKDLVYTWLTKDINLGVVCGAVSGLVVIDIDPKPGHIPEDVVQAAGFGEQLLALNTPRVITGGGGIHIYARHTGQPSRVIYKGLEGRIELRSDGQYVVAPPSIHPTGVPYEWENSPETPLAEVRLSLPAEAAREGLPEPDADEVQEAVNEILDALPSDRVQDYLLKNWPRQKHPELDRSGAAYELARLLVEEHGLTNPQKLAAVVYGSKIHQSKFAGRKDAWLDACRIAAEALSASATDADTATDEPDPDSEILLPPYPDDAFDDVGLASEITDYFAQYTEAPRAFLFFAALTFLGHLATGRATLATSLNVQPKLYTVLVAPPGVSRKSHAMQVVFDLVGDAGVLEDTVLTGVGSGEGLAAVLAENPQCLLYLDEFRNLMQKMRIESSVLPDAITQLFDATYYANATKREHIKVSGAHLSLLGAATLDAFTNSWSPALVATGLASRIWLVAGEPREAIAFPEDYDLERRAALVEAVGRFADTLARKSGVEIAASGRTYELPPAPVRVRLSAEARKTWEAWYNDVYRSWIQHDLACARLDAYGLKLALLFELARGNFKHIEPETVRRVIALLEHQRTLRNLAFPSVVSEKANPMEDRIIRALRTAALTKRALMRRANYQYYGAEAFNRALLSLQKAGIVRAHREGRSEVFRLY